jgi:hypothetical protein
MRTSRFLVHRASSLLVLLAAALCFAVTSTPKAFAADSPDEHLLDQQGIDALEARALQAEPRDQCFLFAQIVHQLTELSAQRYAEGDTEKSVAALRQIQNFVVKMNKQHTDHDKRLKNVEMLLRHTAYRLRELLHNSTPEDQPLVKETLAQIDILDADTLQQVFKK